MTRLGLAALAVAALVGAMALLPLRLLLAMADTGVTARQVSGSVWHGHLAAAAWHGAPSGDVDAGLQPLALLGGHWRWRIASQLLTGLVEPGPGTRGITGMTGEIATRGLLALPIDRIALENVSIGFAGGRCVVAGGTVRLELELGLGGAQTGSLQGNPTCAGGRLQLPLRSADASMGLHLSVAGDGRYQARLFIAAADAALRPALLAAGFQDTPQGLVRHLEGQL